MKKEDEKRLGGTHRGHVSSEFPFALRMSGRLYTVVGENKRESAPFLAENSQCAFMASTESEDWTVEEDGEPAGEPVASTTSARATSSDREEEEEDDEEMADEGYRVEEEEQQQQEEAALGSPEEVRVAAASEEDSDLVQTETTEGEDGYEASVSLSGVPPGRGRGGRGGCGDSERRRDRELPVDSQGTHRRSDRAGTEDRCASIRIHRPFQLFPAYGSVCIVYYSFFLSSLKHL